MIEGLDGEGELHGVDRGRVGWRPGSISGTGGADKRGTGARSNG
jgi:hypothetical protein